MIFKNLCRTRRNTFPVENNGFCKLIHKPGFKRVNLEVLNEYPLVEVYEDFLSENEFEIFTAERLKYPIDEYVNGEQKIIDELLGLSQEAENYTEVVKYRPGGTFHLDYFNEEQPDEVEGHTMIFLREVELGGGFAMPELGIHIKPKPGRMVHWQNMDTNGEYSPHSLYGLCPVFIGNNLVATNIYYQSRKELMMCKDLTWNTRSYGHNDNLLRL